MSGIDLFASTARPDPGLFFRKNDPNDPRFGEIVRCEPADYAAAQVVLLGCPQDEGVRRNGGRPGAAGAPDEIRRCFYKLALGTLAEDTNLRLFDLGNTLILPTLEATHDLQREVVRQVLRDGKRLVILGGGNDISYPDCSALALEEPDLLAFNVDAHFDVRADTSRNSGTPYRQLLEEGYLRPERFHEMAHQPFGNSAAYLTYLREKGAVVHSLLELRLRGLAPAFCNILDESHAKAIFWGFDMDVVRASDAPGVSAPNPLGMAGEELCQLAQLAGEDRRTRIVEIAEVNPAFDIDNRTCRLAAVAVFFYLTGLMLDKEPS